MALTTLLVILFGCVVWGFAMTHTGAGARRAEKSRQPNYMGTVRRYARLGRPIIQTDEQRAEAERTNRGAYDPSLDLLDPRNERYRGDGQSGEFSGEAP